MNIFFRLFVIFQVSVFSACSSTSLRTDSNRKNQVVYSTSPYVILVSIDGYRFDYTDLYSPPELTKIRQEGISAKSLLPVFPSKTFTNHYSIITGLYAENHGIVANWFYDPKIKKDYRLSDRNAVQDGSWYGGTPLWVNIEKQGMIAASFFWPGSEAAIQDVRPSYYYMYDPKISMDDRVNQVKNWLELPLERRPHFITLYFSEVDSAGHKFGPESDQVKEAVLKVDGALRKLREEIGKLNLPVNIVIVSDHGMQKLDPQKVEYLDDYTNLDNTKICGEGPQINLYNTNSSELEQIYKDLKSKGKHFKVYKRSNVPSQLHYSNNMRIGDLVLIATAPYSMTLRKLNRPMEVGSHGYDVDKTATMQGIFYGIGPNLKKSQKVDSFRNIHIYPFVTKILGLKMLSPIDGDEKKLNSLIASDPYERPQPSLQ